VFARKEDFNMHVSLLEKKFKFDSDSRQENKICIHMEAITDI